MDDAFFLFLPRFPASKLIQLLQQIRARIPSSSLLLVNTANADKLQPYANSLFNIQLRLTPIGDGFGRNITGKVLLNYLLNGHILNC